jgi:N-methylhydantoinase B/oxoprolinase/acetone carboxylase alpha subunit
LEKEDQIGDQMARISELSQMVSELEDRIGRQGNDSQKITTLEQSLTRAKSESQFKIDSLLAKVGRFEAEIADKNNIIELLNTQI